MALAGCGGEDTTPITPSIQPVIDLMNGPEQTYISDSAAIVSVTLRADQIKQLKLAAATQDDTLKVLGKSVVANNPNENSVKFTELKDENTVVFDVKAGLETELVSERL